MRVNGDGKCVTRNPDCKSICSNNAVALLGSIGIWGAGTGCGKTGIGSCREPSRSSDSSTAHPTDIVSLAVFNGDVLGSIGIVHHGSTVEATAVMTTATSIKSRIGWAT